MQFCFSIHLALELLSCFHCVFRKSLGLLEENYSTLFFLWSTYLFQSQKVFGIEKKVLEKIFIFLCILFYWQSQDILNTSRNTGPFLLICLFVCLCFSVSDLCFFFFPQSNLNTYTHKIAINTLSIGSTLLFQLQDTVIV